MTEIAAVTTVTFLASHFSHASASVRTRPKTLPDVARSPFKIHLSYRFCVIFVVQMVQDEAADVWKSLLLWLSLIVFCCKNTTSFPVKGHQATKKKAETQILWLLPHRYDHAIFACALSSVPQTIKEGSCDVFQKFAAALVADLPSLTKSTMASPRPDGLENG